MSSDGGDVATVALVVSLIALIATVMQVLQQYYASAVGYSNCDEKVMGQWHRSKERIIRLAELRFEVRFETPVIFVADEENRRGPIPGDPIYTIDGTRQSLEDTLTQLPAPRGSKEADAEARARQRKDGIHTADNERAAWVELLQSLQKMEADSRKWQREWASAQGPPPAGRVGVGVGVGGDPKHTLAVQLQKKKRSWDTMPSNVKRPYATTTICHLVEMTAMLGLHWEEFDRTRDRYRAEGNGFLLMGDRVADLGIMWYFQKCRMPRFEENRVLPVQEVKDFCFGFAPTIFCPYKPDNRRLEIPGSEVGSDLSFLQLGSAQEFGQTLAMIGCNQNTVNLIHRSDKKHEHLFPIAFEVLGMLARTLHIRDSCFRMLPNPTTYRWDKTSFSLPKLLRAFCRCIDDDPNLRRNERCRKLAEHVSEIDKAYKDAEDAARGVQARIRADAAAAAAAATAPNGQAGGGVPPPQNAPPPASAQSRFLMHSNINADFLDALHKALSHCDHQLLRSHGSSDGAADSGRVIRIVCAHIQEVLRHLNTQTSAANPPIAADTEDSGPVFLEGQALGSPLETAASSMRPSRRPTSNVQASFAELDAAGPETKQQKLMSVYFTIIRTAVVEQVSLPNPATVGLPPPEYFGGDNDDTSPEPVLTLQAPGGLHGRVRRRKAAERTANQEQTSAGQSATAAAASGTGLLAPVMPADPYHRSPAPTPGVGNSPRGSLSSEGVGSPDGSDADKSSVSTIEGDNYDSDEDEARATARRARVASSQVDTINAIWCTLVLRMLCWLSLHDFHKKDVQIPKSELMGSRMPVYLA